MIPVELALAIALVSVLMGCVWASWDVLFPAGHAQGYRYFGMGDD